jgi:bacterioferritin-associated ferredoxin
MTKLPGCHRTHSKPPLAAGRCSTTQTHATIYETTAPLSLQRRMPGARRPCWMPLLSAACNSLKTHDHPSRHTAPRIETCCKIRIAPNLHGHTCVAVSDNTIRSAVDEADDTRHHHVVCSSRGRAKCSQCANWHRNIDAPQYQVTRTGPCATDCQCPTDRLPYQPCRRPHAQPSALRTRQRSLVSHNALPQRRKL